MTPPAAPSAPRSLDELRRAFRAEAQAHGGHVRDVALAEELVAALEVEVLRLARRMDRTGTVYHMPHVAKAPPTTPAKR